MVFFFFFQAEDGIRDKLVTGVQTCALPICLTVGDGGAEDDGERGDDDGRAMHTGPPGLGKRLRGDGRVVAPGRVECQGASAVWPSASRRVAPVTSAGARLGHVSADPAPGVLGPHTVRFCPLCGAPTAREPVPPDQREQHVCSRCRFVFYLNPKVVGATLPEQDGAILLTRRSINPGRGLWTFP